MTQSLYSTPDCGADANVYRWNYFYTPVQIGDEIVGVRIAVQDMKQTANDNTESQIYNWNIKKDVLLDGSGPGTKPLSADVSSSTSFGGSALGDERHGPKATPLSASSTELMFTIPQFGPDVKQEFESQVLIDPFVLPGTQYSMGQNAEALKEILDRMNAGESFGLLGEETTDYDNVGTTSLAGLDGNGLADLIQQINAAQSTAAAYQAEINDQLAKSCAGISWFPYSGFSDNSDGEMGYGAQYRGISRTVYYMDKMGESNTEILAFPNRQNIYDLSSAGYKNLIENYGL